MNSKYLDWEDEEVQHVRRHSNLIQETIEEMTGMAAYLCFEYMIEAPVSGHPLEAKQRLNWNWSLTGMILVRGELKRGFVESRTVRLQ